METVVFALILLVCVSYMLKQTFRKPRAVLLSATVCALLTGLAWPWAIEQSRTQIADWLADPKLMLDTAVVLTLEVVMQMAFCLLALRIRTEGSLSRRTIRCYRALRWFPGLLIYPVLFSVLVTMIFAFPGSSFRLVAWCTAAGVFLLIGGGARLLHRLLPDKEMRLELLFLSNALAALLGVIATVNGRTAVETGNPVDAKALASVAALTAAGALAGLLLHKLRTRRKTNTRSR